MTQHEREHQALKKRLDQRGVEGVIVVHLRRGTITVDGQTYYGRFTDIENTVRAHYNLRAAMAVDTEPPAV